MTNSYVIDPRSKKGQWTLNLLVNPSIADDHLSQGLCGMVGSEKLFGRNKDDLTNKIPDFTKSWRYV